MRGGRYYCRRIEISAKMARVGRPSTFILHSLGTRAGTGPRVNVFDDVRTADSAPLPPPGMHGAKRSHFGHGSLAAVLV